MTKLTIIEEDYGVDQSSRLQAELEKLQAELDECVSTNVNCIFSIERLQADNLRLEQARCAAQKVADSKTKECAELTKVHAALSKESYARWLELKEARKCEADLLANIEELCIANGRLHQRLNRARTLRFKIGPLSVSTEIGGGHCACQEGK